MLNVRFIRLHEFDFSSNDKTSSYCVVSLHNQIISSEGLSCSEFYEALSEWLAKSELGLYGDKISIRLYENKYVMINMTHMGLLVLNDFELKKLIYLNDSKHS